MCYNNFIGWCYLMNEDNDTIIYCNRCGAKMKSSSRYCMKCGNLNYDHEANKDLKYMQPKEEQTYQVGSGKMINTSLENGKQNLNIAHNTGNDKSCFFVNFKHQSTLEGKSS